MADEADDLPKLEGFIRDQVAYENKVVERVEKERDDAPYPNPETECKPPQYVSAVHDGQLS